MAVSESMQEEEDVGRRVVLGGWIRYVSMIEAAVIVENRKCRVFCLERSDDDIDTIVKDPCY